MRTNEQLWRLSHGFIKNHFVKIVPAKLEQYDDEFWCFFTENILSVVNSGNCQCIRIMYWFQDINEEDLFNGLVCFSLFKKHLNLFIENPDKLVQSQTINAMWIPGRLKVFSPFIPKVYYDNILGKISLKALTASVNNSADSDLSFLYPKSYKKWKFIIQVYEERRKERRLYEIENRKE